VSGAAPNPDRPGLTRPLYWTRKQLNRGCRFWGQGHHDGAARPVAGRRIPACQRAARQPQARAPADPALQRGLEWGPAGHAPAGRCVLALTGSGRAPFVLAGCHQCGGASWASVVPSCRAQAPRQAQSTETVLIPGRSASAGAEVGCTSGGLPVRAPAASVSSRRPIKKEIGGKIDSP
jgi:hypothetical protein